MSKSKKAVHKKPSHKKSSRISSVKSLLGYNKVVSVLVAVLVVFGLFFTISRADFVSSPICTISIDNPHPLPTALMTENITITFNSGITSPAQLWYLNLLPINTHNGVAIHPVNNTHSIESTDFPGGLHRYGGYSAVANALLTADSLASNTYHASITWDASPMYSGDTWSLQVLNNNDNNGCIAQNIITFAGHSVGAISMAPTSGGVNQVIASSASFTDPVSTNTHTAVWSWGDGSTSAGTVSESQGAGTVHDSHVYSAPGTYTVNLMVTDQSGVKADNATTIAVTQSPVNDVRRLTSLSPAKIWIGLKGEDSKDDDREENTNRDDNRKDGKRDKEARVDLMVEAYKDSALVATGKLDNVRSGDSGFGYARLNTIPFGAFSPVDFPAGSSLKMKVSARTACADSPKNNPTVRLWFGSPQANSQFGATIGTSGAAASNYFLLNRFLLAATAGTGQKSSIDIKAGAKCSPYKSFGTWSITP